ncbi:hypothetical protein VE04_06386 [Pseudogymnoascus sp. 24MN13]|nr:hypothetical protein VE04_06386 [Pseudogymnoascus sp. 24MN13]
MGVAGGAIFPPIQGAVADAANTRISMVVPLVGFVYVLGYVTFHWFTHGRHILRVKEIVIPGTEGVVGGAIETVHYDDEKVFDKDIQIEKFDSVLQVRRHSKQQTTGFEARAQGKLQQESPLFYIFYVVSQKA